MTDQDEPNGEMKVTNGQTHKTVKVNYPGNSNKGKREEAQEPSDKPVKKVEKVISGEATTRKRGLGRKIKDTFKQEEGMQGIGDYILFDFLIPNVRGLIADLGIQFIERTIGGTRTPASRNAVGRPTTNYNGMFKTTSSSVVGRAGEADGPSLSRRARAAHEFDEIVLSSRGEADTVLDRLGDLINQYDVATVADLYDLVGVSSNFTDNRWGWSNLAGSGVERVRGGGYILILPRTEQIQ